MEGITFYIHIKICYCALHVNKGCKSASPLSQSIIRKKPVEEIHILILKISRKFDSFPD